jgi:mycofactocin glycosyltransferase
VRLALDPAARRFGTTLAGGAPLRLLRLSAGGPAALDALASGEPTPAQRRLGERLIDAGLAHPLPAPARADVTVVIPVRDRPAELDRCLAGAGEHVVVVDDGSRDPAAIAAVAARHGARVVRRERPGGPAAARNAAAVDTELVAFLDSDCAAPPGWIEALAGHFADPRVAAVAPRIAAAPLDMGPHPAAVRPDGRVRYVPSAALVVRRAALPPFDETLRYGEDVDLVWRLHDAGWRVRYDPRVVVAHPPVGRRRRFAYGTSAAPLAARHPGRLAPLVLRPWPALAVALLLARRPLPGLAVAFAPMVALRRKGVPASIAARWCAAAAVDTWLAAGRVAFPRPGLPPGDLAYRLGVYAGCVRARTVAPLTPRLQ